MGNKLMDLIMNLVLFSLLILIPPAVLISLLTMYKIFLIATADLF